MILPHNYQTEHCGLRLVFSKMATFGWSYKSNVSGVKRPKEIHRKIEDWQKDREDVKIPLHRQTHSSESVNAGMKRRRCKLINFPIQSKVISLLQHL